VKKNKKKARKPCGIPHNVDMITTISRNCSIFLSSVVERKSMSINKVLLKFVLAHLAIKVAKIQIIQPQRDNCKRKV
jgi:hypothetical protein